MYYHFFTDTSCIKCKEVLYTLDYLGLYFLYADLKCLPICRVSIKFAEAICLSVHKRKLVKHWEVFMKFDIGNCMKNLQAISVFV
jgi:hypothetical protein